MFIFAILAFVLKVRCCQMKKEMESLNVNKTSKKREKLLVKEDKKLFSALFSLLLRGGK